MPPTGDASSANATVPKPDIETTRVNSNILAVVSFSIFEFWRPYLNQHPILLDLI